MLIRPADMNDVADIEALLDAAFGGSRHTRTAARLRDWSAPLVGPSFIARDDAGLLLATVQYWPIALCPEAAEKSASGRPVDGSALFIPLTLLGPVAVAPVARAIGLGRRLIAASLAVADEASVGPILLIGDVSYYGRFGFDATATGGWTLPGPVDRDRLLLRNPNGAALPAVARVNAKAHSA